MTSACYDLSALRRFSPTPSEFTDGGATYIHLPNYRLPEGCTPKQVDVLLRMDSGGGYTTRMYFSERITSPSSGSLNWTTAVICGRTWHVYSWNGVHPVDPISVLVGHLKALVP